MTKACLFRGRRLLAELQEVYKIIDKVVKMKKIAIFLLAAVCMFGDSLELKKGSVTGHTEMMMEKNIDPVNNNLKADVTMEGDDITTLKGKFWVETRLFSSDNSDRDKNMYKDLESDKFKLATYMISSIKSIQEKDSYIIEGELDFHGVKKPLSAKAKIVKESANIKFDANSSFKISDFGIKMPCMVFMCVRDQVDLIVKAEFK